MIDGPEDIREGDQKRDEKFTEGQSRFAQRGRERRATHWMRDWSAKFSALLVVIVFITTLVLTAQVQKRNEGIEKIDRTTDEMNVILKEFKRQAAESRNSTTPQAVQKAFAAIARTEAKVDEINERLKNGE